ncbi:MAG: ribosome maturation factor RimP [Nocardioides sp.]|uniref:ribosome maturation factor RimP n=1 Tax=Nocardioides nematodiphilus TaxID=2849669 RepID=UPI001CD9A0C2|nr:ribosome maturation factor RimP [Nocardioides nematodiphilus]MCA1984032.1 ribosome maturation factor RimP [Nocardioides nematodiphilus]
MAGPGATEARIDDAIAQPLRDLGFDIEAIELTPAGKRRVLRIAVDKDGGITLDDVADATRAINDILDDETSDVMGQLPYTLEVTSRGVDRPLTLPRHWRRNADRLVKVSLVEGGAVTGRIGASDEEQVTLEIDGEERSIRYTDIEKALVQIEFKKRRDDETRDDEAEEA